MNQRIKEPNIMNKFSKEVIIYLALLMDMNILLGWCRNSDNFNNLVCNSPDFWILRESLKHN